MADLTPDNTQQFINQARAILKNISIAEILERKAAFRKVDLKTITEEALRSAIKNVLEVKIDGQPKIVNIITSNIIGQQHMHCILYRVRKFSDQDMKTKTIASMQAEKDAWYPPKEVIKRQGRLNDIGESFLYLAEDPLIAIMETKLQPDDRFYLMAYRSTKPFRITMLDAWSDMKGLTQEENDKLRLINDFLVGEFTKEVGEGTEYLYRVSNIIAKDYLHHNQMDSGWAYPSMCNKHSRNVCFKTDLAQEHLELLGVRICWLRDTTDYRINFFFDLHGVDHDGNLIAHECTSDKSKEKFRLMNVTYFPELL